MEEGVWRREHSRETFWEPDIVGVIRGSKLRWAEHKLRLNVENITEITYEILPEERRHLY